MRRPRKPKDWRAVTPLELLLNERLRRALSCEDEDDRHQRLRARIREVIEASFVVTCSRRHAVRLIDVIAAVRAVMGKQVSGSVGLPRRLIRSVVEEMGGRHVHPRNRRLVNGMRLAGETDEEGTARTKQLRVDPFEVPMGRRESRIPISRRIRARDRMASP